jgi:23S rRNA pseudouridine2605 synthase
MVDKTRNPRREGGGSRGAAPRSAGTSGPGRRPGAQGRFAGKPATGPAVPRTVAGVDRRSIEQLEAQGLLTKEGRRLLADSNDKPGVADKAGGAEKPSGGDRAPSARDARRASITVGLRSGIPAVAREAREPRAERGERPQRGAGAPEARAPRGKGFRAPAPESLGAERLHKVMAQAGVASRRHSEELIQAGRVTVNGKVVTELGTKVTPGQDIVEVDSRPLGKAEHLAYIVLNKPKGYVTTLFDPQGRPKVTDLLGEEIGARLYPVGRLDFETEGLLLLTNDGALANALMHPTRQVKKTYIAKVRGVPGPAKLRALESGIELDDGMTAPAEVRLIEAKGPNAATVSIRIHEGRNRQVRRMFEAVGHEVIHLRRTTLGPLGLKDLAVGEWRELTEREVNDLKSSVGMGLTRGAKVAAIVEKRGARRGAGRPGTEGRGGSDRRGGARSHEAGEGEAVAPRGRGPRAGESRGPRAGAGRWAGAGESRGPGAGAGRGPGAGAGRWAGAGEGRGPGAGAGRKVAFRKTRSPK